MKALDKIFEVLDRNDAPGLVVAVARHGRPIYRRGFGAASIEQSVANTPATRVRIGSASKQFTCLAAFLLAEEGKLDIHAPIGHDIPELGPLQGAPTLRQLMDHTGGLRCYLDLAGNAAGLALQARGRALAAQLRQGAVNFEPGTGQLYCNGGYHLLSIAIERAAGLPFEDVLRTRIFEPLGLHDTLSVPSDMQLVERMATLHLPAPGGGWRRGLFPTEEVRGEGAMVSTVDDMLTWLAHLRAPTILGSADTWRQMTTVATLAHGLVTNYACGLWRLPYRGVELVYHGGNVHGGASQLLTVPEHALDVVILANGAPVVPVELSKRIVDALLDGHLRGRVRPWARASTWRHLHGTRYVGESGLVIGFDAVGKQLGISFQTSPAAPILRDDGATLRVGFEDVAMGPFVLPKSGLAATAAGHAPGRIEIAESGRTERYRRLPAKPPSLRRVGPALLGCWRSDDLDTVATIAFENDVLVMRFRGPQGSRSHRLEPLSSEVFAATVQDEESPGRFAIVLRREGRTVVGFTMNTARTRHLAFRRVADGDRP